MLTNEQLNIIVCPACKGNLQTNENQQGLTCMSCGLLYEVKNGIPVMLADEAKKAGDTEPGTSK